MRWVEAWGGPGDDLAKGLAATSDAVFVVGFFEHTIEIGGIALDAGPSADLAVARFEPGGAPVWATSVSADLPFGGAEIVTAPDGGIVFGGPAWPGTRFGRSAGSPVPLDASDNGAAWIAHYRPDGSVGFATTVAGTTNARPGEIARTGQRLYLDMALRGATNSVNGAPLASRGVDSSVWAIDLAPFAATIGDIDRHRSRRSRRA